MSLRITLLPCLAAALILGACDNDKGAGPAAPSSDKTSLLTSVQWKQNAHSVTPAVDWRMDGTLVNEIFSLETDCAKDDITTFKPDGIWNLDNGPSKCFPFDPDVETGTWKFNAKQDSVFVASDRTEMTDRYKVVELTDTRLILSLTNDGWIDFKDHTWTLGFAAQ
jgi:hypothetical protein